MESICAEMQRRCEPQPIGRPLHAGEAQCIAVQPLRKAGTSLRGIGAQAGLGVRTVRTIIARTDGTDRTSKRVTTLRELNRQRMISWRARKRTRDSLPKRVTDALGMQKNWSRRRKGSTTGSPPANTGTGDLAERTTPTPMPRKYDKGEKRFKHQGRTRLPEIRFFPKQPRRHVGLCPKGFPEDLRLQLLNEAIAAPKGDRDIDYDKRLYVVHEGTIYEAQTSDAGVTYHAFPYRGTLSKEMLKQLRVMARNKKCLDAFERWIKRHIQH
jgi:hypothetical protein